MDTKKKMAAAMAAVTAYMRSQEEAAMAAATPKAVPSPVWGMSGRMAQMQLRNMMQMKAFK